MASESSKLEALLGILRQEQAHGFQDRTVFGGLDAFLQRWGEELGPALTDLGSYGALTPPDRRRWAEGVLARLGAEHRPKAPVARVGTRGRRRDAGPASATQGSRSLSLSPDDDVTRLKGVARQTAALLKRLGVLKVRDLLYLVPHRHEDFTSTRTVADLEPGQDQTAVVTVWEVSAPRRGSGARSTQAVLGDETGNVRAIWFNSPRMARTLHPGAQVVLSGRVRVFRGRLVFESPDYELLRGQEELVHTGRLVPVYPSTGRLHQRTLRAIVKQAVEASIAQVRDFLPDGVGQRAGLISLQQAIAQAHYPDTRLDWNAARRRLAFDELFLVQMAVLGHRRRWREGGSGIPIQADRALLDAFLGSLPFSLTAAQLRVLGEVLEDLKADRPMSRLLQGDVGSGKTVVAAACLLAVALRGYQGALMAPTEILAEQHFMTLSRLLSGMHKVLAQEPLVSVGLPPAPKPITVGLLLGSLGAVAKSALYKRLAEGTIDIVVGTHALIQEAVEVPKLALVVVDEQHRFGVMQRASLREKGSRPHLLAMSATPIPRSLALTVYGDLDMSVIDELPPGRPLTETKWVDPRRREDAYAFVRRGVSAGRQAFIVCPLIEESEALQSRAATEEYQRLSSQVFPDLRLGLLHGRMVLRKKEEVMEQFQRGELDILVSTPVVEVGIDIPNATVMLIDGADRFGLAQLHQMRGRVGRGGHESYCLLLAESPSQEARDRLRTLERIHDGFELAEEDLRMRGPGDQFGTRQSGLPTLMVARITDQDILALARREAMRLLESDPELSRPENRPLAEELKRRGVGVSAEMS